MDNIKYIFELIKKGKHTEVIEFLKSYDDIDVNVRDEYDNYLINYAIIMNSSILVAKLIHMGCRLDITDMDGRSVLYIPIKFNYADMVFMMLQFNNVNVGIPLLDIADKNGNIPFHYAIIHKNYNISKKFLETDTQNIDKQDNNGYNILHLAIRYDFIDIIKDILRTKININSITNDGETVLHMACNKQHNDTIKLLLEHKSINVNIQDRTNEYAIIHIICISGNLQIFKLLLDKDNVNINLQDYYGNTPLHYLLHYEHYECIEYLFSHPRKTLINLNVYNVQNKFPIHILLGMYNKKNYDVLNRDIIGYIIENSSLNYKNNDGDTPLHLLCKYNLWYLYKGILSKKKLNIFLLNNNNMRPVDHISKQSVNEFVDLVSDSYLNIIKKTNNLWTTKWENSCKIDDHNDTDKQFLESEYGGSYKNNICKEIIRKKLINSINNTNEDYYYPRRSNYPIIDVSLGKNLEFCTFTGVTFDVLVALLYLLSNHKNVCSTIDSNFYNNPKLCNYYKSLGYDVEINCKFINFEIIWIGGNLYYNDDFHINFKKCNSKKRFTIIPVGIELEHGSHANYIIFDKDKMEIERFEPNGSTPPYGFDYGSDSLDDKLTLLFSNINKDIVYIKPSEYIPKIGFQFFDSLEMNKTKIGDPNGFCAVWSVWYTEMRIKYPDINRKLLVRNIITKIREQKISFRDIIRNYSHNIILLRDKILNNAGVTINDFINDNYTKEQFALILNNITDIINNVH